MFDELDPTLGKILEALQPDDNFGILLAAQLGGTPEEIQLIVQTTDHIYHGDEGEGDKLRITGQYIVRAIGVVEHQLALGFFRTLVHSESNPLLYAHNDPLMEVSFTGKPEQVDGLMLELNQLYGQTYGIYDPARRMTDELNLDQPLTTLLTSGDGVLGHMPEPFAVKVARLLGRHNMEAKLLEIETDRAPIKRRSLILDNSYIIAQFFTADPMGREKPTS